MGRTSSPSQTRKLTRTETDATAARRRTARLVVRARWVRRARVDEPGVEWPPRASALRDGRCLRWV